MFATLDMHQLGGGMIYVISILENYSRCILASMLSRSQDLTAYLIVPYAAIRERLPGSVCPWVPSRKDEPG